MNFLRVAGLWGPVVVYVAFLTTLSGQSELPEVNVSDKVLHVGAYALLGLLVLRAFHGGITQLRWRAVLGAVAFTVGYGALDEFHQSFVEGRSSNWWDVVADLAGALLAVAIAAVAGWWTARDLSK